MSEAVSEAGLARAVDAVRAGEVIGIPTDTVYGLGADPWRPETAGRLFAIKGRPESVALPVLVGDPAAADELAELDERALRLAAAFWPGPLTLVVRRRRGVELHLGGEAATVGIRCPGRELTRTLLRRTGPLAVTSANRHGERPFTEASELAGLGVSVVVDGGTCDGAPSSVVSLVGDTIEVLREGALSEDVLLEAVL